MFLSVALGYSAQDICSRFLCSNCQRGGLNSHFALCKVSTQSATDCYWLLLMVLQLFHFLIFSVPNPDGHTKTATTWQTKLEVQNESIYMKQKASKGVAETHDWTTLQFMFS